MKTKTKSEETSPLAQEPYQTRLSERVSYGMYFFGQGAVYTVVSQFLMIYYTDYALIAPMIVSFIMFGGKVWDAVNDTLFGLIMDKVKFKSGNKFLPWLRISTIGVPLATILLFVIPSSLPMWVKVVFAVLGYLLWDTLYTVCDAPIFALTTAMTSNVKERGIIMMFSSMGGSIAIAVSTVILVPVFNRYGFLEMSLLLALLSFIFMGPINLLGKERHKVQQQGEESPTLKETWLYLRSNKYLLTFYGYRMISGCLSVQMLTYLAKYCLGDIEYMSKIVAVSVPFIALIYVCTPAILKRFNKIMIFRVLVIADIFMNLITYFIGYQNKGVVVACMAAIACLAILPSMLTGVIPADCVEYGTYKSGYRKEGITFSLQTFTSKLTAAFASAITGFILTGIGYNAELEVMPESVVDGIWNWTFWMPIIGKSIALVLLFVYNLKDRDVQLMSDVNEGKITRAEAEAQFSHPY